MIICRYKFPEPQSTGSSLEASAMLRFLLLIVSSGPRATICEEPQLCSAIVQGRSTEVLHVPSDYVSIGPSLCASNLYIYIYICMYTQVCMYICIYVHIYIYMHIYITYIFMYMHIQRSPRKVVEGRSEQPPQNLPVVERLPESKNPP